MNEVKVWYMTSEELAEYREKYPPKTQEEIKQSKKRKSNSSAAHRFGERRKRGRTS